MLSDADDEYLLTCIKANQLDLPVVLSSEQLQVYKPHVSAFDAVADRLGVPVNEVVHVGDSHTDVVGARHAGAIAVWVNRDGRTWPPHLPGPHAVIRGLHELPELLRNWTGA